LFARERVNRDQEAAVAEMAHDAGGPSGLLADLRGLRRRTRSRRHAYWFPLILFGLLTCASVPFYVQSIPRHSRTAVLSGPAPALPILGGFPISGHGSYLGFYWLAALLGALLLTQLWYWWHARRTGVATQVRWYVITTAAITVLALLIPLVWRIASLRGLGAVVPGDLVVRGTFPFVIVAAGLLVLAWIERSLLLGAVAVIYSAAAMVASLYDVSNVTARLGWILPAGDEGLPNILLPALILILGAAAAFAVSRHQERA
jgi:hypothetical protein